MTAVRSYLVQCGPDEAPATFFERQEADTLVRKLFDESGVVPSVVEIPRTPVAFERETPVTIYKSGMFGIRKTEARQCKVRLRKYAQYDSAVEVAFLLPRKRVWMKFTDESHPSTLILDGWGHPDPVDDLAKTRRGEIEHTRLCFDDSYQTEFDEMMARYLVDKGRAVLADYRGHSSHLSIAAVEARNRGGATSCDDVGSSTKEYERRPLP